MLVSSQSNFLCKNLSPRMLPMALRRLPSKPLSRGAPIAYVPRGKETLDVWESTACALVLPVSGKWARPLPPG
jgi:hypothetical protein